MLLKLLNVLAIKLLDYRLTHFKDFLNKLDKSLK